MSSAIEQKLAERIEGFEWTGDLLDEHDVEVGDRVRSYDFPESIPGYQDPDSRRHRSPCFVEGTVVEIVDHPESPCQAYKIAVERRVWGGEETDDHAPFATPPVNGVQKTMGGVTFGVVKIGGSGGGGNPSDWLGREIPAVGFDGDLKVASARGQAPGSNPYVATGTDEVEATLDGQSVTRGLWCDCGENGDGPATVYFEIREVDAQGEPADRTAHGHACVVCRRMVQVG